MQVCYFADSPESIKQIAQWYFDEWGHHAPDSSAEKIAISLIELTRSRSDFPLGIVVLEDDIPLAAATLIFRENPHHPEYEHWLGGVYVAPAHRGRGLASLLIEKAKQHVADSGIKDFYLQCKDHNIGLYAKHGFQQLHTAEYHGTENMIMVWSV